MYSSDRLRMREKSYMEPFAELVNDLWNDINETLKSYLKTDEDTKREALLGELRTKIKEFLNGVNHGKKFSMEETLRIIGRNLQDVTKFNVLKAIASWKAIFDYGCNLLGRPWKREFKRIDTYSGFFQHQVIAGIADVDIMLELMGYKHTVGGLLTLTSYQRESILTVTRDAIFAMVEYEMLHSIRNQVSMISGKCDWGELLKYRETHVGAPKEMAKGILELWELRQLSPSLSQRQMYNTSEPELRTFGVNRRENQPPAKKLVSSLDPEDEERKKDFREDNRSVLDESSCFSSLAIGSPSSGDVAPADLQAPTPSNGTTTKTAGSSVGRDAIVSPWSHIRARSGLRELNLNDSHSRNASDSNYRPRHNSASSVFDFDENDSSTQFRQRTSQLEKNNYTYANIRKGKPNDRIIVNEGGCETVKPKWLSNPQKKYEIRKGISKYARINGISEPTIRNSKLSSYRDIENGNTEVRELVKPRVTPRKDVSGKAWNCANCTFLNVADVSICDMCCKSRSSSNDEPLVSGGRECAKCTLVNAPNTTKCQACDAGLENSPTYI